MQKVIYGQFTNFVVGTGEPSTFVDENGNTHFITVVTLRQEDGSGNRFLINFKNNTLRRGYVDFKTKSAYIYEK